MVAQLRFDEEELKRMRRLKDSALSSLVEAWREKEYQKLEIKKGERKSETLKVGDLKPGLKGVRVRATVVEKSESRIVEAWDGRRLLFSLAVVSDETGTIKVPLFGRRVGMVSVGDIVLVEGVMRASQKLGGEAAKCAIYTKKGNIPRGHDHRSRWGELFDTVVTNTGTLENSTAVMSPEAAGPGNWEATSTEEATNKGKMALDDSLGTCRFNSGMDMEVSAEAISAVTGWAFSPEEAFTVGRRTVNLMKAFNVRCGIGRELDYPSTRYGSTPVDGPSKGISIMDNWEEMLDNYYKLMGWDVTTGKPLPDTLRKLGIEHVIQDIW